MNIDKRLEKMRQLLEHGRPCRMTVTFTDGTTEVTDPAGALDIFRSMGPFGAIASVKADRTEFEGLAMVMNTVCHPTPNRRIADYE